MSAAAFPVAIVLAFFVFLALWLLWRLLITVSAAISHWLVMRELTHQCGSRARANRILRAIERETLHGIPPLAASSVPSLRSAAAPVGGSARLAARRRALEPFQHLTFARHQAD